MPSEKDVYEKHAIEYEALVAREDYPGNILKSIKEIVTLDGLDVLDLGSGTGRLAGLLAPHVHSILAFDLSPHMLGVAREKLNRLTHDMRLPTFWLVAASDYRFLPLADRSADLIVSGWSVSYVTVWHPENWRFEADAWLAESKRVLRKGGIIILFESLGTGNESPLPLAHLKNFYSWLDDKGFKNKWIRTDYQFESPEKAGEIAGFFFGDEMNARILRDRITILPECTGVWWLDI
jgi:ubiquinone/menaquinone biosynthesis C-methylase UbiE